MVEISTCVCKDVVNPGDNLRDARELVNYGGGKLNEVSYSGYAHVRSFLWMP